MLKGISRKFVDENVITFGSVGIDIPYDIIKKIIEFLNSEDLFNFAICSKKICFKEDLEIEKFLIKKRFKGRLGFKSFKKAKNFPLKPYVAIFNSRYRSDKVKNFFSSLFHDLPRNIFKSNEVIKSKHLKYVGSEFETYGKRNSKNIAFLNHDDKEYSEFKKITKIVEEEVMVFSIYSEILNFSVLQNCENLRVFICNKFFFKILFEDSLCENSLRGSNCKLRTMYVYEHKFQKEGLHLNLDRTEAICKEFSKYPMKYELLYKCLKIFNLKFLYCEWPYKSKNNLEEILDTYVKTEKVKKLKEGLNRDFKVINIFIPFSERDKKTFFLNKSKMLKNFEIPRFIKLHLEQRLKFDLSKSDLFLNKIKKGVSGIFRSDECFTIYEDIGIKNS
jgi:hypothetical protein